MIDNINNKDLKKLKDVLTPKMSKYCPHRPFDKQAAFLLLDCKEALYGGAAGGGKSDCLLMAALQYVDIPGYRALLLRRTFQDLSLPGALMDRAKEWLAPHVWAKEVTWIEKEKTFLFPSGATITFGYLEAEKDKYRYQSAEFQFIGFDELTQFTMTQYTFMFSRLRRLKNSNIPLRMRGATNPDGEGLPWVKARFIDSKRVFIPSSLEDNPHLDQESYEQSLNELDPITRARLRDGNWDIKTEGTLFSESWFPIIKRDQLPSYMRVVRYWDFAGTDEEQAKKKNSTADPDYTAGVLLGEHKGIYYILDVRRFRQSPEKTEESVKWTASLDGYSTYIGIEEEPGSSGKIVTSHYIRNVLRGYPVKEHRETGNKVLRANPVSSAAERELIYIVEGPWNKDLLEELVMFPNKGYHDDQVDALSGAFRMLRTFVSEYEEPIESVGDNSYWLEGVSINASEDVDAFPFAFSDSRYSTKGEQGEQGKTYLGSFNGEDVYLQW